MPSKMYLIRHCISEANGNGALCGVTDSPLSGVGVVQAKRLTGVLQNIKIDRVVSSPLARALDTAEISIGDMGISIETIADLCEIDFGKWENMTCEEIENRDKKAFDRFMSQDENFGFPEGESLSGFYKRIGKMGQALLGDGISHTAVFTHGGVIRHLLCHYLELPFKKNHVFNIQPGSVVTLDFYDGRFAVLSGIREV